MGFVGNLFEWEWGKMYLREEIKHELADSAGFQARISIHLGKKKKNEPLSNAFTPVELIGW